jgi:hypothetical protein
MRCGCAWSCDQRRLENEKKGKKQRFSATKAVKAAARNVLGMPTPTKVVPDAKTKAARRLKKHKPNLEELLEEDVSR